MIKNVYESPRVNIIAIVNIERFSLKIKKKETKIFTITSSIQHCTNSIKVDYLN